MKSWLSYRIELTKEGSNLLVVNAILMLTVIGFLATCLIFFMKEEPIDLHFNQKTLKEVCHD